MKKMSTSFCRALDRIPRKFLIICMQTTLPVQTFLASLEKWMVHIHDHNMYYTLPVSTYNWTFSKGWHQLNIPRTIKKKKNTGIADIHTTCRLKINKDGIIRKIPNIFSKLLTLTLLLHLFLKLVGKYIFWKSDYYFVHDYISISVTVIMMCYCIYK